MGRVRVGDILDIQDILFTKKHTESGMLVNAFNLSSGRVVEFKENLAYLPSFSPTRALP